MDDSAPHFEEGAGEKALSLSLSQMKYSSDYVRILLSLFLFGQASIL